MRLIASDEVSQSALDSLVAKVNLTWKITIAHASFRTFLPARER